MLSKKTFFTINLIYLCSMVSYVLLKIAIALGWFSGMDPVVYDWTFTLIIQVGLMAFLPLALYSLFFKKHPKQTMADFGFKKTGGKIILLSVIIGLCAFVLNLAISSIWQSVIQGVGYAPWTGSSGEVINTVPKLISNLILVAVLPGICEEIAHRGLLTRGFGKAIGYKRAILFSAILFGLIHLNINQTVYAAFLGILMAVMVVVSDSIWPAIIVHFINNAFNIWFSYAYNTGAPGHDFYHTVSTFFNQSPIMLFLSSFALLALLSVIVLVCILAMHNHKAANKIRLTTVIGEGSPATPKKDASSAPMQEVSAFEEILPATSKDKFKPNLLTNMLFFINLGLGALITIFTFVWGVL